MPALRCFLLANLEHNGVPCENKGRIDLLGNPEFILLFRLITCLHVARMCSLARPVISPLRSLLRIRTEPQNGFPAIHALHIHILVGSFETEKQSPKFSFTRCTRHTRLILAACAVAEYESMSEAEILLLRAICDAILIKKDRPDATK